jgi:ketosteroid isomerase-like protein
MSENADTIRQAIDDFNEFHRGALSSKGVAEGFDPQIEMIWQERQTYPDFPQQLQGVPECIAFAEEYRDRWIDLVQEPLELIEAPGGRVLALVRQSGRGRQSGVPIVIHFFELCTIRDGKVRKIEYFRHRADALKAVGLEQRAMSENLDLVRSIYADWERGDYGSAQWAHPNIELIVADGPSPGRSEGLPAMAASARDPFSVWEDLRAWRRSIGRSTVSAS